MIFEKDMTFEVDVNYRKFIVEIKYYQDTMADEWESDSCYRYVVKEVHSKDDIGIVLKSSTIGTDTLAEAVSEAMYFLSEMVEAQQEADDLINSD